MPYDYDEFLALKDRGFQPTQREKMSRDQLIYIEQAGIAASLVTGDPAWDVFLSYIQRAIEDAQHSREGWMVSLVDPRTVDPEKVARARMAVMTIDERIKALQWVIEMPVGIKKVGAVAKEYLDKMDLEDAEG